MLLSRFRGSWGITTELDYAQPWGNPGPVVVTKAPDKARAEPRFLPSQWPHLFYKQYHEVRERFSSSQLETAECPRAWGYRYLLGLRTREYSWTDTLSGQGTKKDRSLAFGKALHAEAESYFGTGHFNQSTAPGRALIAGLHLLPHPTQCNTIEIELPIDLIAEPKFIGYKDLVAEVSGEWYLFDYKSTKSFEYQKGLDDRTVRMGSRSFEIHGLRNDLAGASYAVDVMLKKGLTSLRGRWVYFKSEGRPEAKATDVGWELNHAQDILGWGLIKADQLVRYIRAGAKPTDLPKNGSKCDAFGGCPYHKDQGGPCEGEEKPQYLLGTELLNQLSNTNTEGAPEMSLPQQPGESPVQFKIRQAREIAAGQAPAPAAPQAGFAPPPPGGFMTPPGVPPGTPPAQQQTFQPPAAVAPQPQYAPPPQQPAFAPPPMPPPPAAPAYAPVTSHVLPPESAQVQTTIAPVAPQTPAEPPPVKRAAGRPKGSKNTPPAPGTTLSQPYAQTVEIELDFGSETSVLVRAGSTEDAQALAGLIQAALS